MTLQNKNRIRTITLWIGILTALLLIIGSLSMSAQSTLGERVFGWLYQTEPMEGLVTFSSSVINYLSAISF